MRLMMSISVNWQEFACIGMKTPTSGFLMESLRKPGSSMAEVPTKLDRIDGWKSVADYLNRDVTTVIRWAKLHGLPVNRPAAGNPRRAVFALKSELRSEEH